MAISITALSGGNSPADGSDPRTFPAIWNTTATALEGVADDLDTLQTLVGANDLDSLVGVAITSPVTGDVLTYNGTSWLNGSPAGSILQVVSTVKTDTFSASVTAGASVAVTGLSITHTMASASNKLLITAFFGAAASSANRAQVAMALADGGTLVNVGDAAGSRTLVTAGGPSAATTSTVVIQNISATFLYEPGDTASHTYDLHAINSTTGTETIYINQTESATDDGARIRSVSSLIIQEVAG